MSTNSEVTHEGKRYKLLPFSFLDKIGSAIVTQLGKKHDITKKMYVDREVYGKRGIFYIDTKNEDNEPAFALTNKEIDFLRNGYVKSQEVF